jgi:hypothetical protein
VTSTAEPRAFKSVKSFDIDPKKNRGCQMKFRITKETLFDNSVRFTAWYQEWFCWWPIGTASSHERAKTLIDRHLYEPKCEVIEEMSR